MLKGIGSVSFEDGTVFLGAGSGYASDDGELEGVLPQQVALGSADVVLLVENGSADDGDGVLGGSVVAGHLHVQLADGSVQRDISVLFVHVVDTGSGLVAEDDAKGLDMVGFALMDFVDGEDLALSALGLELPAEVVPELGFGDDRVSGEESEGVDFR